MIGNQLSEVTIHMVIIVPKRATGDDAYSATEYSTEPPPGSLLQFPLWTIVMQ